MCLLFFTEICNSPPGVAYTQRDGTDYCYRYFDTAMDFSNANRSCVRNNAALVRINTVDEDTYINSTYYKSSDFWIGLSDQRVEGIFRYYNTPYNSLSNNASIIIDGLMETKSWSQLSTPIGQTVQQQYTMASIETV